MTTLTTGQLINLLKEMPDEAVFAIPQETATDDDNADYARYFIRGVVRDDKFNNVCIMCYVDEDSEPAVQGAKSAPRRNLERDRNDQNKLTPNSPPEQLQQSEQPEQLQHLHKTTHHDIGSQTLDDMRKEKHKKDEDEKKVPRK